MAEAKKLVPKRRFKEFQNGEAWEERKLGELSNIVRGASPRPIKDPKWFDDKSEVGWLRIADVTEQDGRITFLEQRISEAGQEKTRVLYEPHLLLSIAATVGKPVVNYVKTGVHDGFLIFLNPKFDQEFMFQWFEMFRPKWQQFGQPGSQVNLNSDLVKNTSIMLPKEDEQAKLGSFLKSIDNLITLHQRKLDKIKSMKKAYLYEMFPAEGERKPKRRFKGFTDDWEQRKLSKLAYVYDGTHQTPRYTDEGIMFLSVENIKSMKSNKFISIKDFKDDFKVFPEKGDVLMTKIGDIGTANIYDSDEPVAYYVSLALLKNKELDPHYLKEVIGCDAVQKELWHRTLHIAFPKKINKNEIEKIIVPYPKEKLEQEKIGKLFNEIDNLITLHQQKLDKLKNLKKSYLNEMFI